MTKLKYMLGAGVLAAGALGLAASVTAQQSGLGSDLTPMGALVGDAPEEAKTAMERQVVEGWAPHVVNGRMPVEQPMALAWGVRPRNDPSARLGS